MKNTTKLRIGTITNGVIKTRSLKSKGNVPHIPNQERTFETSLYNTKGLAPSMIGAFLKPKTVKK